jgi:uncharacterized membrane protein YfcA
MSYFEIGICLFGGFIAGVINTLAGSGSVLTLAILTEFLGLPGGIANGTNRIGIALQTVSSSWTFQRARIVEGREQRRPLILIVLGAVIGIGLALVVSNESFMFVFKYMVVFLFLILLIKPKRWIQPDPEKAKWPPFILNASFFLLGIYGGFIQLGMGVFFLAISVLGARMTLLKANAIKVLAIGLYTVPAILFFALDGKVHWLYGGVIGTGQLLGGWLTARFAVRFPGINTYAYYALLLAVLLSMASLFDLI